MKRHTSTRGRVRFRSLPDANLPRVIPPRSLVILAKTNERTTPEWRDDLGRIFRIGYYNRQDGTDCIWLVNDRAEYEQTTDRASLLKHFIILKLSDEPDVFGDDRPLLKPLRIHRKPAFAIPALVD